MRCARSTLLALALVSGCAHAPQSPEARAELPTERPWIRNVKFVGASHVSASDLRKALASQETSFFTLLHKRYYSPSALAEDKLRVAAFYGAHGFSDARVTATEVRPRWRHSVDLYLTIDEGLESRIAELRVRGLEPLGEAGQAMVRELGIAACDRFEHERYLAARGTLLQLLRTAGRAWATVEGRVEVDRDAHRVVVALEVAPGPEVRFGAIEVEGARAVAPRLVELEADLPVGQRFSPQALEAARGRLHNLSVFSTVRVEPRRDPEHPEIAPVRITVVEDPHPRQLRLGVGFGLEGQRTEVHARLSITWNNFLGGLRKLELRLETGWVAMPAFWQPDRHGPQATLEAKLTQPHFPFAHAQSRVLVGYDVGTEFAYRLHGPRLELGLSWALLRSHVRLGVTYGFQFLDFFDVTGDIFSDPVAARRTYGFTDPYRLAWLQEQLVLDWRDQPLGTRKGLYFEATAEEGGPYLGGAFYYESITVDGRGYLPLGRRVVLAVRARYGRLFSQGGAGAPTTRRFYGGGPSSQRGFNFTRLSPFVLPAATADNPVPKPVPVGGDELVLGQLELRVDLFRLFGSWVGAVAFCDAADVVSLGAPGEPGLDLAQLHVAVGGGLRYNTLIGSIRFDVGVRLNRLGASELDGRANPDPGERYAFHLSIGEAF